YGWVFIGMALFFAYALLKPAWNNARGPLMGFVAYDLVLLVPFLQHFAVVRPGQLLQLIVATGIVIGSGTLAVYYLCLNKMTRVWPVPQSPGGPGHALQTHTVDDRMYGFAWHPWCDVIGTSSWPWRGRRLASAMRARE